MKTKERVWKPCRHTINRKGGWTLNRFYHEIPWLHRRLRAAEIPHDYERLYDGWHISYPSADNCVCSVVEHLYSYGHERDLLETDGLLTEEEKENDWVAGNLEAVDVFARIEAHWRKETK